MVRVLVDRAPLVFPVLRRPRESQGQRDNAGIHRSDRLESAVVHMSRMSPQLEAVRSSETNALVVHAQSQLTPSIFDRDGVAPDRHLPDPRRYWPLPFSTIRGNAGGDAKATCAEWRWALRVELRLLPDSAA